MPSVNESFTKNNLKLDEIMDLYELQYEELPTEKIKRTKNDLETIEADAKRNFTFQHHFNEEERELFKKDVKKLLTDLPLQYVQSMCDIVEVLMYFYYTRNKQSESPVSSEEQGNPASTENFEYKNKKRDSLYDPETYDRMLRTIYNILKQKYTPLVDNKFNLYYSYNETFMKLMKKRGIKVRTDKSLVFMNATLTWFSRSIDNIDDIYKIFAIIISCPLNCVFLFLIHYFDEIDNKKKIKLTENEIMKELFKLEQEFCKVADSESKEAQAAGSKKGLLMAVTAGAVVTGAIILKTFWKK